MSEGWNISESEISKTEKFLEIASATALDEEALESFAQLVNGLNAPRIWRDKVRYLAAMRMEALSQKNTAPAVSTASIGRALALVKEPKEESA